VLENAGHRDPSMAGVDPDPDVTVHEESTRDDEASTEDETGEDQSSLGDF